VNIAVTHICSFPRVFKIIKLANRHFKYGKVFCQYTALNRRGELIGAVNTIDVPSVDGFIRKIEASEEKVVLPKTPVPGVGYMAYCQDTEGNTFGLLQEDTTTE
jgi:hypothetical protein